jgi:hypothetical protein
MRCVRLNARLVTGRVRRTTRFTVRSVHRMRKLGTLRSPITKVSSRSLHTLQNNDGVCV